MNGGWRALTSSSALGSRRHQKARPGRILLPLPPSLRPQGEEQELEMARKRRELMKDVGHEEEERSTTRREMKEGGDEEEMTRRNCWCLFAAYSLYSLPIHSLFATYSLPVHCLFTACLLPSHCLVTGYALPIHSSHCVFTACSLPVYCLFTGDV
jgi:hypothetical protein